MTEKEKKIQIALGTYLSTMWEKRTKMKIKAHLLNKKVDELSAEAYHNLNIERARDYLKGLKLRAEADKTYAEASKLRAEADLLYIEAVMEVSEGKNVLKINWETGEVTYARPAN